MGARSLHPTALKGSMRAFSWPTPAEALIDDRPPMDGAELINQKWFTLEEAAELDLPSVTRFMLGEVNQRLMKPDDTSGSIPPSLDCSWSHDGSIVDIQKGPLK